MELGFRKVLPFILLLMAVIVFVSQLRSLFIFPEPNSFRWFGDETWLMSEAHEQITTGMVRYPLAIGSLLENGKGLVLSMTWLSAILYGLPIWLAGHDPVAVGRCVTAVLALLLLMALYTSSRMLGVSQLASSLVTLLLVSTRSFFFASHSARPDLLAGMLVLLVVAFGTHYSRSSRVILSWRWWFSYGALFMFLSVSSSIHLLTLLMPVALFFFWRLTKKSERDRRVRSGMICTLGALSMLTVLIVAAYIANGSLELLPASATQFQDVLHSIPVLRPFSRSVQVANLVTRGKQFISEAPVIWLFPLILPFVWKRGDRHTFAIASLAVCASWLLLEGAEINYLIHILPLLCLGFAIAFTTLTKRWKFAWIPFMVLAIIVFLAGLRDSGSACKNASIMDESNQDAARLIEARITSSWPLSSKPVVLTESPMLDRLSQDTSIQSMTDHFISFPVRTEPFDSFFIHEHVNYAVLYNSPVYPKDRPRDDPFYQSVGRSGRIIARYIGTSGDIGRDYFDHSNWRDTILLFQFSAEASLLPLPR